jgi:hypothetical protein
MTCLRSGGLVVVLRGLAAGIFIDYAHDHVRRGIGTATD